MEEQDKALFQSGKSPFSLHLKSPFSASPAPTPLPRELAPVFSAGRMELRQRQTWKKGGEEGVCVCVGGGGQTAECPRDISGEGGPFLVLLRQVGGGGGVKSRVLLVPANNRHQRSSAMMSGVKGGK